jgi:hypothetical protein
MAVDINYFNTDKDKFIELFSNPEIVRKNAKKYDLDLVFSPRKNKKYRIVNPETNKFVDFGSIDYEDYTKHQNLKRLEAFKKRNAKWYNSMKYSPAWLSAWILWT